MRENKRTLYIGAHEDDVFISSAISISRNPKDSYVLCVADGVSCTDYPAFFYGIEFSSREEFVKKRLKEDKIAFNSLGLDIKNNYFNFQIYNERTHLHIDEIIYGIMKLVKQKGIERIVSHEFPKSHPDHETVSFCSHYVANETGIDVWEYPMYGFKNGKHIDRIILTEDHEEVIVFPFSKEEFNLRERLIRFYESQLFIIKRFSSNHETFGKIKRDFRNIPSSQGYFYGNEIGHPQPSEIRNAIKNFTSN